MIQSSPSAKFEKLAAQAIWLTGDMSRRGCMSAFVCGSVPVHATMEQQCRRYAKGAFSPFPNPQVPL